MTARISYVVTATLPDAKTSEQYVLWLEDGHLDHVIAGGATSAMIVRLDAGKGDRPCIETRYEFPSREAFDEYIARHAPTLRAEGLKKFPPASGVTFERRMGAIL